MDGFYHRFDDMVILITKGLFGSLKKCFGLLKVQLYALRGLHCTPNRLRNCLSIG